MSDGVHIYEWCRRRKYFGRTQNTMSHLLLDKGILSVPESAHEDFIHEYSRGVLKGGRPPCIVEYKLPIFRMFYDLDIVVKDTVHAKRMSAGDFDGGVRNVMHTICLTTVCLFDVVKSTVTVCISNIPKKTKDGGIKLGIHLTFDTIYATTRTALYVREKVLEHLNTKANPFANPWDQIVDAAVFKGSGMRLPWSAKQDDPKRVYIPRVEYVLDSTLDDIRENVINPDEIIKSLVSIKDIITRTCLRSKGVLTNLRDSTIGIESDSLSPTHSGNFSHASLGEYSNVINEIEKVVPSCYSGRFTGVVKSDHVYMFRHSSKYCMNVGRDHTSSNTYFMVSRSGMRQCCYSRKDDGNKCSCSDYRGDYITLSARIMNELFPGGDVKIILPPKPKEDIRDSLSLESLILAAKKKTPANKKKIPNVKKIHRGSAMAQIFA